MKASSYRISTAGSRLKTSGNGDGIPLARSSSASRFLDRLLPRVFRRPAALSITLEGDTPSAVTLQEPEPARGDSGDYGGGGAGGASGAGGLGGGGGGCGSRACATGRTAPNASSFLCHLCNFAGDRITILDRHLLDDHKIGLDNLLKLVMAQIKSRDAVKDCNGSRAPYYQPSHGSEQVDATSLFEKLRNWQTKEYRTVGTNTGKLDDAAALKGNCYEVTRQLEQLLSEPLEKYDQRDLVSKMAALNAAMCNVVDLSGSASPSAARPDIRASLQEDFSCHRNDARVLSPTRRNQTDAQHYIPLQKIF